MNKTAVDGLFHLIIVPLRYIFVFTSLMFLYFLFKSSKKIIHNMAEFFICAIFSVWILSITYGSTRH